MTNGFTHQFWGELNGPFHRVILNRIHIHSSIPSPFLHHPPQSFFQLVHQNKLLEGHTVFIWHGSFFIFRRWWLLLWFTSSTSSIIICWYSSLRVDWWLFFTFLLLLLKWSSSSIDKFGSRFSACSRLGIVSWTFSLYFHLLTN